MWIVVCFEDNTIAAVPQFWYDKGKCAWPKKSPNKFIERRIKPNEVEFMYLKSKIIKNNMSNLFDARSFAKDNSEILSNENCIFEGNQKNKNNSVIQSFKEFVVPKLPTISFEESQKSNNDEINPDTSYLNTSLLQDELFNTDPINTVYESSIIGKKNMPSSNSEIDEAREFVTKRFKVSLDASTFEMFSGLASKLSCENENDQVFKKFMIRNLTCKTYEIEVVEKRFDSMTSLLETFYDKILNSSISLLNNIYYQISDMEIISIDNYDDLVIMEERLTNNRLFRTQVVLTLTELMGDNISETVYRIMQKIFTDKFLSNYSYIGFKEKSKLSHLQSCSIIFSAVQKMKKFHDIPMKDIEEAIKLWVAQASERIGKNEN